MPTDTAVGYPTLTSGSADPRVIELAQGLNELGFDVEIGDAVTPELLQAVDEFRRKYQVEEDPDNLPGSEQDSRAYITPDVWRSLFAALAAKGDHEDHEDY
jgi:peptidoglycan hydrolase-like protein with peptidoglycan-binding domain